jgi:hypothetical protein
MNNVGKILISALVVFLLLFMVWKPNHSKKTTLLSDVSNTSYTNEFVFLGQDPTNSNRVFVATNRAALLYVNRAGIIMWSNDLTESIPPTPIPTENFEVKYVVDNGKIRDLSFADGQIYLRAGKSYMTLEKATGRILNNEVR